MATRKSPAPKPGNGPVATYKLPPEVLDALKASQAALDIAEKALAAAQAARTSAPAPKPAKTRTPSAAPTAPTTQTQKPARAERKAANRAAHKARRAERARERMTDPDGPATSRQLFYLHCLTGEDTRAWKITKAEAAARIEQLRARRSA